MNFITVLWLQMPREIYFEIKPYGQYVRVHAIDSVTGIETFTTGPKTMGITALKNAARRKLDYVIRKKMAPDHAKKKNTWLA